MGSFNIQEPPLPLTIVSLSTDVKLSRFTPHLTGDGSHIKLGTGGRVSVPSGGLEVISSSHDPTGSSVPGKQYCHKWFRAAESAKLLFGSPAGDIPHFTRSINKTLGVTDCKPGKKRERKKAWLTKICISIFRFTFLFTNLKQANTSAVQPKTQGARRKGQREVINCGAFGRDLWSIAALLLGGEPLEEGCQCLGVRMDCKQ